MRVCLCVVSFMENDRRAFPGVCRQVNGEVGRQWALGRGSCDSDSEKIFHRISFLI